MNTVSNELRAHAYWADDFNSVLKLVFWKYENGKRFVLRTDQYDEVPDAAYMASNEDRVLISKEQGQRLMDCLWEMGFRPSNGEGTIGQVDAMKEHIASLQSEIKYLRDIIDRSNMTVPLAILDERQTGGSDE